MGFPLRSPATKAAFALPLLALCAAYLAVSLRSCLAARMFANTEAANLLAATSLEPNNAEYRNRLGRWRLLIGHEVSATVSDLEAATRLNPHRARYWLDLALAHQITGNVSQQQHALENALAAEPTTPEVAWEAANFLLVRGETTRALRHFKVVLQSDPSRTDETLRLCWRATQDPDALLEQVLPPEPRFHLAFLSVLMEARESAAAAKVWARLISLPQKFPPRAAFAYLDYLVQDRNAEQAWTAWKQLAERDESLRSYLPSENLIVNGGLEETLLNGGFDWRWFPVQHVSLRADTSRFHQGTRSLLIDFQGQNPDQAGFYQFVRVAPNTRYEFSGYLRAEDLVSASGPRIAVDDAYDGTRYVLTEDLLGTSMWQERRAEFTTGEHTELLIVRVVRVPGYKLIKGRVWIDDFRLKPK